MKVNGKDDGKDDIPYVKWNINNHVWNHQPGIYIYIYIHLKSQLIIGIINTNLAIGLEHHLAITLVFFQAQSSWTTLTSGKGDKPYAIPAIPDGFNPWKLNWGRTWYGDEVITDCFLQVL